MTTIFVYEHCCAIGLGREPSDPAHSLYREGRAMRDAAADDFRRVPGVEVVTLDGDNAKRERDRFRERAAGCDWCLVIAPELGHELTRKAEWATKSGARLLGPSVAAIEETSCKIGLARHWEVAGVPTPRAETFLDWFREPSPFPLPVVCKPVSGAGSTATARFNRMDELMAVHEAGGFEGFGETELMLQEYVPGRPASVAFLVGPRETIALPPAFQRLSSDGRLPPGSAAVPAAALPPGDAFRPFPKAFRDAKRSGRDGRAPRADQRPHSDRFRYKGGELPIRPDLAARAVALGRRAIACVPGLSGYVGVDLVLGDAGDYAIEINSRLTTSYVGLRALADFNLAEAMLRVARGGPVGELAWKPGRVGFRPDGTFERDEAPGATFS
jgi:predicted ATP-grasp superfamily ATP-dependent carboligase